jgi:MFS family permease
MSTAAAKYPPLVSGLVLASYYGGYTLGTAVRGSILLRVGQIRLFAALAGIVAASVAMQPVLTAAPAWILMRLVTGIGYAGLFIVAESWLNGCSNPGNRGLIFAVYLVATNAAFGGGRSSSIFPSLGASSCFA